MPQRPFFPGRAPRRNRGEIHPLLFESHRLMRAGDFETAATMFEALAGLAESVRQGRSPGLYLQSGRAYILAGNSEAGQRMLRRGFDLLIEAEREDDLIIFARTAVAALVRLGHSEDARQMAGWLEERTGRAGFAAELMAGQAPTKQEGVKLPTRCPSCSAPIYKDQVEWVDEQTAVCSFCGTLVRGESA